MSTSGSDDDEIRARYHVSRTSLALTRHFYDWEMRLRGYDVWPYPVSIEPPFVPLYESYSDPEPIADDARKEIVLSRIASFFTTPIRLPKQPAHFETHESVVADDDAWIPDVSIPEGELVAFQINLPPDADYPLQHVGQFLRMLQGVRWPLSFELVGTATYIVLQLVCRDGDRDYVLSQLEAFFPAATITQSQDVLQSLFDNEDDELSIVDFALSEEVILPFTEKNDSSFDPFTGVVAALGNCRSSDLAALQVLFTPCRASWSQELQRSVIDDDGSSFFSDAPHFVGAVREKTSTPLYSAVVRAVGKGSSWQNAHGYVKAVGSALGQFGGDLSNRLMPLTNDDYPDEIHELDVVERFSHRTGMLLSSVELVSLVHLPLKQVAHKKLIRTTEKTKECPRIVRTATDFVIGENTHRGITQSVYLNTEQRLRHTYVVGASGTGKSTLLLHMMREDVGAGNGIALLDPHGDLSEDLLAHIPEDRARDVVFIDPSDSEFPVGLNIFHASSAAERTLIASDLPRVFERLSSSWGDQMHAVLSNGILAMLAHKEGGTLLTLRRFLLEKKFRSAYLKGVEDSEVVYYWNKVFPTLSGRPYAPVLTRLDTFLRSEIIRHMVAQIETRIDYDDIMASGKILVAKLAHGAIGEENAALLGTLIVTALHQAALRRESLTKADRNPFFLYIDEFQNFVTPTMESMLSGARKYGVGLTLAHQELRQLASRDRDVASSVLSNPYTRICFRVGDQDAHTLSRGFSSFSSEDLQSLGIGQAIVRTEQAQYDFTLATPGVQTVEESSVPVRDAIVEHCREAYAASVDDVVTALKGFYEEADQEEIPVSEGDDTPDTELPVGQEEATEHVRTSTPKTPQIDRERVKPPESPGRGGPSHKYLQSLIKRLAQERGYIASVEQNVEGGIVDVALQSDKEKIACEITVTTSPEHEWGNIRKCLDAGFDQIVVLAHEKRKLGATQRYVKNSASEAEFKKIHFLLPEAFVAFLDVRSAATAGSETRVRGYKVKVNYSATDEATQKSKQEAIAKLIVESMKRMK